MNMLKSLVGGIKSKLQLSPVDAAEEQGEGFYNPYKGMSDQDLWKYTDDPEIHKSMKALRDGGSTNQEEKERMTLPSNPTLLDVYKCIKSHNDINDGMAAICLESLEQVYEFCSNELGVKLAVWQAQTIVTVHSKHWYDGDLPQYGYDNYVVKSLSIAI